MHTYEIRTFGCQMNKHDSERLAGILEADGMRATADGEAPDLLVFMTCCVRKNADERLYGQVAAAKALKYENRDVMIAVGGCIAQRDGEALVDRLPHVDIVFGTHNLANLPILLEAARAGKGTQVETLESGSDFTSDLPSKREHAWHAWMPITVGCDNFCTYCIVPYVRGRERSRPVEQIVAESRSLVSEGVREITLLGQNVNSYGRDLYGSPRFAGILHEVAETGIERIRFATSHPKDLSDDTIDAMATLPAVCTQLHLPLQSGSDRILAAMNRGYTRDSYLRLVDRLYSAMPGLALSTDIIVGFPGESDADFEETMHVVNHSNYDQAFTFIYSPRAGTPAANMENPVDPQTIHQRFDRLVDAIQTSATSKNRQLVGTTQRVLVEGTSKRDVSVLSGRTEGNKVVHAPVPDGVSISTLCGRFFDVRIDQAHTWFLTGELRGYDSE